MKNLPKISVSSPAFFSILALIIFAICPATAFAGAEIGAFLGTSPPTSQQITDFETMAGKNISSVLWYEGWNSANQPSFDSNYIDDNIRYHDGYDTATSLNITSMPYVSLPDISSGAYDNYLQSYASSAKQWGGEVRFRFGHEMIDDDNPSTPGWYPWQDNPEEYKAAFQHVYNIFRNDVGADNVKFVWSPNNHISDTATLEKYYPGKDYVDWIGIDGYNWGYATADQPWGYEASFDDIFYDIYQSITQNTDIFGDKPIMLGEFASAEGTSKADWITEAFQKIKDEYTEIEAFYWFNIDKERNWKVDSSDDSLAAFIQAISDAYFTSHASTGALPPGGGGSVDPSKIPVTVNLPPINTLNVEVAEIKNNNWQTASNMDFGILSYDPQFHIFRGGSYYAVDVGIISNQPSWTITHTVSTITNGIDTLDNNINVTFVKQQDGSSGTEMAKTSFADSDAISFTNLDIEQGAWLRIYYGIAAGSGDAPGVEPITITKSAGTYSGSITLTLTNL